MSSCVWLCVAFYSALRRFSTFTILYLKWNLVVRWLVVVVFLCTYSTVLLLYYSTYRNFLKILSDDFAHALFLASGLTSENASKKNSPQAAERVGTLKC